MRSPDWLKRLWGESRIFGRSVSPVRDAWINSLESSALVEAGTRAPCVVKSAAAESRLVDALALLKVSALLSIIYRWTTQRPAAAVVRIDLRESRLLVPALVLLGIAVERVGQFSKGSFLYEATTRISPSFDRRSLSGASTVLVAASASFVVVSRLLDSIILTELLFATAMAAFALLGYRMDEYV